MRGLAQGKEEGFNVYAKISLLSSCDPTEKIKEILQNSLAKDVEQRKKYNLLLQDKVQVLEAKPEVDTEVWENGKGFGGVVEGFVLLWTLYGRRIQKVTEMA